MHISFTTQHAILTSMIWDQQAGYLKPKNVVQLVELVGSQLGLCSVTSFAFGGHLCQHKVSPSSSQFDLRWHHRLMSPASCKLGGNTKHPRSRRHDSGVVDTFVVASCRVDSVVANVIVFIKTGVINPPPVIR